MALKLLLCSTFAIVLQETAWSSSCPVRPPLSPFVRCYERIGPGDMRIALDETRETTSVSFEAFGKKFRSVLRPDYSLFAKNATLSLVKVNGTVRNVVGDMGIFLKGHLEGDPSSSVFGTVHHGFLDGTITTQDDQYFIEAADKYFRDKLDFVAVIYRGSDVLMSPAGGVASCSEYVASDRSNNASGNSDSTSDRANITSGRSSSTSCCPRRPTTTSTPTDRRIIKRLADFSHSESTAKYCSLKLVIDHTFNKFVKMDVGTAMLELHYHMAEVNGIFRGTDFDGDGSPDGVGFKIVEVDIFESNTSRGYTLSTTATEDAGSSDDFLTRAAQLSFAHVCAGLVLTSRPFEDDFEPRGRAFQGGDVNSNASNLSILRHGGACTGNSPSGSRNVAFVTLLRSDGLELAPLEFTLAVAHQLGHLFGATHDPDEPFFVMTPRLYLNSTSGNRSAPFGHHCASLTADVQEQFRFSNKSITDIRNFLIGEAAHCLRAYEDESAALDDYLTEETIESVKDRDNRPNSNGKSNSSLRRIRELVVQREPAEEDGELKDSGLYFPRAIPENIKGHTIIWTRATFPPDSPTSTLNTSSPMSTNRTSRTTSGTTSTSSRNASSTTEITGWSSGSTSRAWGDRGWKVKRRTNNSTERTFIITESTVCTTRSTSRTTWRSPSPTLSTARTPRTSRTTPSTTRTSTTSGSGQTSCCAACNRTNSAAGPPPTNKSHSREEATHVTFKPATPGGVEWTQSVCSASSGSANHASNVSGPPLTNKSLSSKEAIPAIFKPNASDGGKLPSSVTVTVHNNSASTSSTSTNAPIHGPTGGLRFAKAAEVSVNYRTPQHDSQDPQDSPNSLRTAATFPTVQQDKPIVVQTDPPGKKSDAPPLTSTPLTSIFLTLLMAIMHCAILARV